MPNLLLVSSSITFLNGTWQLKLHQNCFNTGYTPNLILLLFNTLLKKFTAKWQNDALLWHFQFAFTVWQDISKCKDSTNTYVYASGKSQCGTYLLIKSIRDLWKKLYNYSYSESRSIGSPILVISLSINDISCFVCSFVFFTMPFLHNFCMKFTIF